MARPVGLSNTSIAGVRTITGSPVAADSSSFTDENFAPIADNVLGGAVTGFGFQSLWWGVEFTGGASPTVTLELLVRDSGAAVDGTRWKLWTGFAWPVLDGTGLVELRVDSALVFPRLSAVTGAPTGVLLLAYPGLRLAGRSFY
jgi:hypothetical protein